jgi:hypothetical protein
MAAASLPDVSEVAVRGTRRHVRRLHPVGVPPNPPYRAVLPRKGPPQLVPFFADASDAGKVHVEVRAIRLSAGDLLLGPNQGA